MKLVSAYSRAKGCDVLYELLKERTPEQSISHQALPTKQAHAAFYRSMPYQAWYLIVNGRGTPVGAAYVTHRDEIGIFIFKRFQDQRFGKQALAKLREMHPGPLLANINPQNHRSIAFFVRAGARHIQNTYRFD